MNQLQAPYIVSEKDLPFILPDEVVNEFRTIAENVGKTHRQLGRIMTEYMNTLPYGKYMEAYNAFSDLYYQITGEKVSSVTVRHWRHSAIAYNRNKIQEFEALSDSQLTEAISLAEINKVGADEICQWCIDHQIKSVPQMRAHWLPTTGTPEAIDPPALSGIIRLFGRLIKQDNPHYTRLQEIITEIRGWL